MAESDNVKTLEAKCLCGSVHLAIKVPRSSLPLKTHLCHCSICRNASGAPCIFHSRLPAGLVPEFVGSSSEENMTEYMMPNGVATWNFCSTCGCHVASKDTGKGIWVVATSIFTDHGPENFQIWRHIYSKSAKDGGIANMLTHMGDREMIHYNPPDDDPKAKLVENEAEVGQDGKERLRAKCHCGGVSFTIPRPPQEVIDDKFMSQFVSRTDKSKWVASWDVCNHCRMANGTHIVGWTFFPLSVCEPPIKDDLLIGTAKSYQSSAEVLRSFCGTCGATFFFSHTDRQPSGGVNVVDLATGTLRAPEGVMAENWLTWRARMAWADTAREYDAEFTDAMQEGMNKWVLEREGKIDDFNIG